MSVSNQSFSANLRDDAFFYSQASLKWEKMERLMLSGHFMKL